MNLAGVSSFAQIVAKGFIVLLAVVMASESAREFVGRIKSWVMARRSLIERGGRVTP
jgi:ribose/xylose/arabinose/galactoside ABC-type transport system permease subunit